MLKRQSPLPLPPLKELTAVVIVPPDSTRTPSALWLSLAPPVPVTVTLPLVDWIRAELPAKEVLPLKVMATLSSGAVRWIASVVPETAKVAA
jgi:hypothetical protein